MSDKDQTSVFMMKVEGYVGLLEPGRKTEWSKQKTVSVVWMYKKKVIWSRTTTNLSGNGKTVTSGD
jgi:hypothetical protein